MNLESLIPLNQLCAQYQVEISFFKTLNEFGLIEIEIVEESHYLHEDKVSDLERIIRMHHELEINFEGIDTIFHLLERIEALQSELIEAKNRLRLYED